MVGALVDDLRAFPLAVKINVGVVIWRDSIAARVPDQNSCMSLEKGSTLPDADTAFGLVLKRAILDGSAGLTYATLQSFCEYHILIKAKEFQRGGAWIIYQRVVTDFLLILELPHSPLNYSCISSQKSFSVRHSKLQF